MIRRLGRKKYDIYAFDIESHNDEESIAKMETSMWLGCFINEESKMEDESSYIYDMEEFLDRLEYLSTRTRKGLKNTDKRPCKNICVYIYNLSFEWSFILPYMLKRGFKFNESISEEDEYCFNSVSTKSVSSVWQVQMKFSKNGGNVLLRDLAKIFGGGLGNVAKAFNLPTQKGEIDYRLNRLKYYDEYDYPHYYDIHEDRTRYEPTKEEKEYCFKDTRIIIDILLKEDAINDNVFFSVVSMASYSMKHLLQVGYPRKTKPYKEFRKEYPELNQKETDFLRAGVGGGITYAPSRWQFKDIKHKILHIDAHQMHPSQGYLHYFPYGEGTYHEGKPYPASNKIRCCHVRISYNRVKLHSIISLIGIDFIEDRELTVWDFEIPTMYKCYEGLEIEYIDYYEYNMKKLPWKNFYKENYIKRLEAKKNKDAYNTLRYKLLNNSSYGKLLEKPHNETYANIVNNEGIIDSDIIDKDIFHQEVNAKYTYLPVGSCIPAYSRVMLIETALLFGYEKVLYFDTDSIFVLYDEETKRIWESDLINKEDFLGGWALEEISDRAQFTAPKRYKLETDGEVIIKAGGINFNKYIEEKSKELGIEKDKYEVDFDEINIISSVWQVQRAFRCKGGTIIDFQQKEISVPKKYESIYKNNIQCYN